MAPRFGMMGFGIAPQRQEDGSYLLPGPLNAPNIKRRHSRATWQPWPMGTPLSAGTATTTSQVMAKAPCRSNRMRVAFGSAAYAGNTAYSVTGLVLGTTNTLDTFTPSVGGTVTEDPTTGLVTAISAPLDVPQNTLAMASKVWSNWVRMPLLQDANGAYLWLARYQFSGAGSAYASSYENNSRVDTYGNYWQMKRVTTNANAFCGADAAAFGPLADAAGYQTFCHTLEAQFGGCEGGQISAGAFGASTIYGGAGGLGTDNRGGFIATANKYAQTNGINISITNHAKNTQTTEAVYQHIVSYGINSEYDAILMPVFSSNDGYTAANVELQMARAFEIREQAAAYGQTVLFVILPHNGASSGDALAVRTAAEARLFAAGGVIDLCPIVQGATRYTWDAAYSGDGVHASEPGVQRLNTYAPKIILDAVKAHCL